MLGFSVAFRPDVLLYAFSAAWVGTLVGMLPGIGSWPASASTAGDVRSTPPRRSSCWPAFITARSTAARHVDPNAEFQARRRR